MTDNCVIIENLDKKYKCSPLKIYKKEKLLVDKKLNSTCKKLYWFFKRTSLNGCRKVAIKDCDLTKVVDCAQRTLFVNLKLLNHYGVVIIELTSHKGKSRASPRKIYTFRGIGNEKLE